MLYSQNNEFKLITHSFMNKVRSNERQKNNGVLLGIGDDCALVSPPSGYVIAISTDTLVEGRHFLVNTPAAKIAYKAFMVTVSDLAAMGADPAWISLALTLPNYDQQWMTEFSEQFHQLAEYYEIDIIGGDTTKGSLTITLTVQGLVKPEKALHRNGAQIGDKIYVSGTLGDSALGLLLSQNSLKWVQETNSDLHRSIDWLNSAYHYPKAQIELGALLSNHGLATSCIDLSDGLASDLQHICTASGVCANIYLDKLPASKHLSEIIAIYPYQLTSKHNPSNQLTDKDTFFYSLMLSGGDDYQLCFTVPPSKEAELQQLTAEMGIKVTSIGEIISCNSDPKLLTHVGDEDSTNQFKGLKLSKRVDYWKEKQLIELDITGFDHFS